MGQKEVLEFIDNSDGQWYTAKQIADSLKVKYAVVSQALRRLRKSKFIEYSSMGYSLDGMGVRTIYRYKKNDSQD